MIDRYDDHQMLMDAVRMREIMESMGYTEPPLKEIIPEEPFTFLRNWNTRDKEE